MAIKKIIKKVKRYGKELINLGGDVLSYPKRTLYDALRAGRDAEADDRRIAREKKKEMIKRYSLPE